MKIVNSLIIFLFGVLMVGCSSHQAYYMPQNMEINYLPFVAKYIAPDIATQVPAKQTVFEFKDNDDFSMSLSKELKSLGYGAYFLDNKVESAPPEFLKITYTMDWIGLDRFYVTVNLGEKQKITKLFYVENGVVLPENQTLIGNTNDKP